MKAVMRYINANAMPIDLPRVTYHLDGAIGRAASTKNIFSSFDEQREITACVSCHASLRAYPAHSLANTLTSQKNVAKNAKKTNHAPIKIKPRRSRLCKPQQPLWYRNAAP